MWLSSCNSFQHTVVVLLKVQLSKRDSTALSNYDTAIFLVSDNKTHIHVVPVLLGVKMNLADQIHENAQLKKKIAKLEEKLILTEVKDQERVAQIKDLETQVKVLNKQLAEKRGYKIRDESYGEKRKEKYDEIRAKYGLKQDSANPFDEQG